MGNRNQVYVGQSATYGGGIIYQEMELHVISGSGDDEFAYLDVMVVRTPLYYGFQSAAILQQLVQFTGGNFMVVELLGLCRGSMVLFKQQGRA